MHMTTRHRILEYLGKQQTATVREMSFALAMTGANIRHHLAMLISDNLVVVINQNRDGRGRPVNVYGLARLVLGDGLGELATATLNVWLGNATEAELEAGLRSVALWLGGQDLAETDVLLPHRLTRLIERLNELHYQSAWEAGMYGPNVILKHCPFTSIIASNPELCRMDAFLLEQWTGLPVEQTAMLQKNVKGYLYCTFRITGSR
jgi:predicted ArsR family transcriptional regulator